MATKHEPNGMDRLAELYEQVVAEGRALGVPPEVLLQITGEAYDLLRGGWTPASQRR